MTISRLLNFPITLVARTDSGTEDSWGTPVETETETVTKCYFQQSETIDADGAGETTPVSEELVVNLSPDENAGPYDAVKLDIGRGVEEFEVVGQPSPALNARTGKINHLQMTVRRAAP